MVYAPRLAVAVSYRRQWVNYRRQWYNGVTLRWDQGRRAKVVGYHPGFRPIVQVYRINYVRPRGRSHWIAVSRAYAPKNFLQTTPEESATVTGAEVRLQFHPKGIPAVITETVL